MANLFVNLPAPAGDGVGAGQDTSAMGRKKTLTVEDPFTGAVNVEISLDAGATWGQVASFSQPAKLVLDFVAQQMRVRRTGIDPDNIGLPNVDVASNNDGSLFFTLVVPAGDGIGASANVSAFGVFNTVNVTGGVTGEFTGSVVVQISEDALDWADSFVFTVPSLESKSFTAQFVRVVRKGVDLDAPGLPVVTIGAVNDAGAGGAVGGGMSNCLIFRPGSGLNGPVVFALWPDLMTRLAAMRASANGSGCYQIFFDQSIVTPVVIPAGGPYDMSGVEWIGYRRGTPILVVGAFPNSVTVNIDAGATFTFVGEMIFTGAMVVSALGAPAPFTLSANNLITVREFAIVRSLSAAAPLFSGSALIVGDTIQFTLESGQIGNGALAAITMPVAGTFLSFFMNVGGLIFPSALSMAVGTTLRTVFRTHSALALGPQPAFLGTYIQTAIQLGERMFPRNVVGLFFASIGDIVRCDPTAGAFSVFLPTIDIFNYGQKIIVKNITASLNAITVDASGAQTIDGALTNVMATAFAFRTFVSNGVSNWDRTA